MRSSLNCAGPESATASAPDLLKDGPEGELGGTRSAGRPLEVALVGNPNVGKSALFGALTGTYVTVSNYPGTTVALSTGHTVVSGQRIGIIDTPGAGSFHPSSEDERVTRDILLSGRAGAVVVVGDAKNLERTLLLALQVAETRIPFVLCLNMVDEARACGIEVDEKALSARLGVPTVSTVAIRREGVSRLLEALSEPAAGSARVTYPPAIEEALTTVTPLLPPCAISPRSLALLALAGDETLSDWLSERMRRESLSQVEQASQRLRREFPEHLAYVVNRARMAEVSRLAPHASAAREQARPDPRPWARRLETLSTHPIWGLPLLAAVLYFSYLFVGVLGAKKLVDLLEQGLFGKVISPAAIAAANRWIPWSIVRDLLVGPYGVITMALAYALALVLPIVSTFFLAFGALEDSGYLPRLAVMVNRVFKKMGLNGKAVLPMVLGLGCDTMATLTTRILETPKERLIVILLLALGVPCSAQLTVVMAMLSGLSPWAVLI
ncbi:MAG TPA: ferrous iron transport protein B, partial [Thermoanaerobaculia bacterium]